MSSSIEKAEQRLNKGEQVKEDMALMLAPHTNLIQQITPAPITVAVLAELALLSTAHTDFKLEEPKGGFKRLQWTMFKPSLMQVSHDGWQAFNKAHSSMNEIRQQTDRIPGDMKEVLNILFNMQDDQEVAALLPISLKSLEDVADSCLARSKEVEGKFNSVREVIDELLQSSLSTESTGKDKKESLELSRIQKEKEEAFLKTQKEDFKRKCEKAEKEVEKRSKDYDNALSSMPSGWSLLGMKVVEGLSSVVSEGLVLFATQGLSTANKVASKVGSLANNMISKLNSSGPRAESTQAKQPAKNGIEAHSFEDRIVFNNMKHHPQQIQHGIKSLFDDEGYNRDAKEVRGALVIFKQAAKDLNADGVSASLKQHTPFYKDLIKIIECVEDECLKGTTDQAAMQRSRLEAMMPKALELEVLANAASSTTGLNKQTPFMSKAVQNTDDASTPAAKINTDDAATLAAKMAQTKMEMTSAQLNQVLRQIQMNVNLRRALMMTQKKRPLRMTKTLTLRKTLKIQTVTLRSRIKLWKQIPDPFRISPLKVQDTLLKS